MVGADDSSGLSMADRLHRSAEGWTHVRRLDPALHGTPGLTACRGCARRSRSGPSLVEDGAKALPHPPPLGVRATHRRGGTGAVSASCSAVTSPSHAASSDGCRSPTPSTSSRVGRLERSSPCSSWSGTNVLADPEDNKACVCTYLDREDPEKAKPVGAELRSTRHAASCSHHSISERSPASERVPKDRSALPGSGRSCQPPNASVRKVNYSRLADLRHPRNARYMHSTPSRAGMRAYRMYVSVPLSL
jgi:hypothetical protein